MDILYRGSPSFRSWEAIKHLFFSALICVLVGAAAFFLAGQGLFSRGIAILVAIGLVGLCGLWLYLWHRMHLYIVTSRGVRLETGFLVRTNQRELPLRRIQMIDVRQNILERLFLRTGDVVIGSAASDSEQDQIVFFGVPNPQRVAAIIREGEYEGVYEPSPSHGAYQPQGQPWNAPSSPQGPAPWDRSQEPPEGRPPLPPDPRY